MLITREMAEKMSYEEAARCKTEQDFESREIFELVMDKTLLYMVETGFLEMGVAENEWMVFWEKK